MDEHVTHIDGPEIRFEIRRSYEVIRYHEASIIAS